MKNFRTFSSAETRKFARTFAKNALRAGPKTHAAVIGLRGPLGGGKTAFAQGFSRGLGIRKRVASPTFILMRETRFKQSGNSKLCNFVHIDAYRAEAKDFLKLGFKKLIADPKNIILIEWADKLKKVLPKDTIWFAFEHGRKENERIITAGNRQVS